MLKDKELNALIKHYKKCLGDIEVIEYTPAKDMMFKPQLILSKANARHPYHVVATVGLSELKLKGAYTNCELIVLLDEKWKLKFESKNYNWPLELLLKISNMTYLTDGAINYGQYFINDNNKTFSPLTDMGIALIGIPAMLDKNFFEMRSGKKTVNFFTLATATLDELKLIKHMGGINFIQRYLLPEGESAFIIRNSKI